MSETKCNNPKQYSEVTNFWLPNLQSYRTVYIPRT